jgi:hypothetical protein
LAAESPDSAVSSPSPRAGLRRVLALAAPSPLSPFDVAAMLAIAVSSPSPRAIAVPSPSPCPRLHNDGYDESQESSRRAAYLEKTLYQE